MARPLHRVALSADPPVNHTLKLGRKLTGRVGQKNLPIVLGMVMIGKEKPHAEELRRVGVISSIGLDQRWTPELTRLLSQSIGSFPE